MTEEIIALDIIIVFLNRKNHDQYRELVNTDTLDRQTYDLLKAIDTFYKRNLQIEQIDIDLFCVWFTQFYKLKLSTEARDLFNIIFSNIKSRMALEIPIESIIKEFNARATRQKLLTLIHEEKDFEEIKLTLDEFKKEDKDLPAPMAHGIEALMPVADPNEGLKWRLDCLNKNIGPLSKSTFVVVAGSVDAGKTSLVASEVTFMSQQLKDDEVVLWFVTENTVEEAKKRVYCAMLERPWDDFWEYLSAGKANSINKSYLAKTEGRERIEFFDAEDLTLTDIEKIIASYNAKLIILDMLDDMTVPSYLLPDSGGNAPVKARYQWGLRMAKKYCTVIATSQFSDITSDNPEHHKYPFKSALAESRIAKQGKATVLLFLGRWEHDNRRYLSTPKNKRRSDRTDFRACVQFDSARSIFKPL